MNDQQLRRMADNATKPEPEERLGLSPDEKKIKLGNNIKDWQLNEVERIITEEELLRESHEIDRQIYDARSNL